MKLLCLLVTITVAAVACAAGRVPGAQMPAETASAPAQSVYPEIRDLDASSLRTPGAGIDGNASIRYRLSGRGLVRLRLVDKSTPGVILLTLLDWAPRDGDLQTETWDGRDRKGGNPDPYKVSAAIAAEPYREALSESDKQALSALRYPEHKHFQHPIERCGDLNVKVINPVERSELSGMATIDAEITGRPGIPDPDYHVVVYIDGRNAWDGRVTEPRLRVPFDTRNIPNGEHTVAVTFNDLHDHAGSDWLVVVIDNK